MRLINVAILIHHFSAREIEGDINILIGRFKKFFFYRYTYIILYSFICLQLEKSSSQFRKIIYFSLSTK